MQTLRTIKKSKQLHRSVESQSRQIIASIFSANAEQALELISDKWKAESQPLKVNQSIKVTSQIEPISNLLLLLQHLSHGFYLDICSFLFPSKESVFIARTDKKVRVKKEKNQKGKVKYWFSDIYFSRLRQKLADQLLSPEFKHQREVVHFNEQKQYMPSCVAGRHEGKLIREIKIGKSSIYRKRGQQERKHFCVGYYTNGAQQLFSFQQVLSFVDYSFNLAQIAYFKILPMQKEGTAPINSIFNRKNISPDNLIQLERLGRIARKEERWQLLRDDLEELKNKLVRAQKFQEYCSLLTLEIISFVELNLFIQVKQLKLEWTLTVSNGVILSNASIYRFIPLNRFPSTSQGLATLYQKCQFSRISGPSPPKVGHYRSHKHKTEEKVVEEVSQKLPLLGWKKKKSESTNLLGKLKSKGNSCILRLGSKYG